MNIDNNSNSKNSLSILSLLGLVFITLKLCGVIDWSWWFVLMPFYIPFVILFVVCVVLLLLRKEKGK